MINDLFNPDTIVIGAGMGGLTAAAKLAHEGKRVLVIEQHYIPGGCATTFKRKDFIMEVGLHEMDGLNASDPKLSFFKEIGLWEKLKFQRVPEFYRFTNGKIDIVIPDNMERAIEVLTKAFPREKRGISKYFKTIGAIHQEVYKLPDSFWIRILLLPVFPILFPYLITSSSRFAKITALLNPLFWLCRPRMLFWRHRTIGTFLDQYIKDDQLKTILLANLAYYHDDPYTMSLIYYATAQAGYYTGGGHFIKGGSQQLSNNLASYVNENGGLVLLGKKVSKILVDNGKATGVVFNDAFNPNLGEVTISASNIIANLAIPLVPRLLPLPYKNIYQKKINQLQPACSLLSVYIGFKSQIKELSSRHYSTFVFPDSMESPEHMLQLAKGCWENKSFVFVDYSQIDSGLAPYPKSFGCICAIDYMTNWDQLDPGEYKKEKEKVAQIFLDRLEKLLPGFKAEIEYYEVATAKTIERYTSNPVGTPYGFAQLPGQAGVYRMASTRVPVKNLQFASAWGFPGGGFTGAILSGLSAAKKSRYSKSIGSKVTTLKKQYTDTRIVELIDKRTVCNNTLEIILQKPVSYTYTAGQFAVVEMMNPSFTEDDMPFRSLSMLSHPAEDVIRFAVRLSHSSYKKSLQKAQKGDRFIIYGPMGVFGQCNNQAKATVFLASGIGITPILPQIQDLLDHQSSHRLYLLYSNRLKIDAAYHSQLQSMVSQQFTYIPVYTREADRRGRICAKDLTAINGYVEKNNYFLCGTNGFVQDMVEILRALGVPISNIQADDFG